MEVGVVGTGYVGLVSGTCFADLGLRVTCVDTDAAKLARLQAGEIPIFEPGLEALVAKNAKAGRLRFSGSLAETIRHAQVLFIAVGTPPREDGTADLSAVEAVAREVGRNLDGYRVLVTKSTVPAGTGAQVRAWVEAEAGPDADFDVVSNPEFLREGSAIEDFMRPDRIVVGTESEHASQVMRELYKALTSRGAPLLVTNVETAEVIKYASNAFLAAKVTFINQVADLCEKVGADV
ncbi:MAG: UDP-glucose/GDP-mannose dehydrogenase family protein, partial [Myxococcales bacterium]|nr:UDP-glucose/GDP-mannose dehydrogenase family protein [Myxococcales bacterium]